MKPCECCECRFGPGRVYAKPVDMRNHLICPACQSRWLKIEMVLGRMVSFDQMVSGYHWNERMERHELNPIKLKGVREIE